MSLSQPVPAFSASRRGLVVHRLDAVIVDEQPAIGKDSQQVMAITMARSGDQLLYVLLRAAAARMNHLEDAGRAAPRRDGGLGT